MFDHSPLCIPLPPEAVSATGESTRSMGLDLRLLVEPVADELVRPLPDVPALPPPLTLWMKVLVQYHFEPGGFLSPKGSLLLPAVDH